jgi:drug/metabolite transporter (DMT)-like permease
MVHVMNQNRAAICSLAAAGVLWGLSVPLSKLSLAWLTPGWLTAIRFAAAAPLLAFAGRRGLREAMTPWIAISGAIGFGAVIMLQNAGIERTSVSHAAVLVGAVPLLVALIAAGLGQSSTKPLTWAGYGLALAGIALVAGHAGSGATGPGDVLVLGSAALSAAFIAVQPRMLAGRDATAVTAVQFAAGALVALPIALTEGAPQMPAHAGPVLAVAALSVAGSLAFPLFAFGQARVPAELAGAFVNLEPVVGVAVGWIAFGDSAAIGQLFGAAAVLLGIALSTVPPDDWARWTAGWQIRLPNGLRALTNQRWE